MLLAKKSKRTQIEAVADSFFGVYLATEFIFKHTLIGQIGIILFICSVFLLGFEKRKFCFSYYFVFSVLFILYNYLNVRQGGSISDSTSLDMIRTLIINFIILLFIFNYLIMRNNMRNAVDIFIRVSMLFTVFVIAISIPNLFSKRLGVEFMILGIGTKINSNNVSMISAFALIMCFFNYLSIKKKSDICKIIWFILVIFLTGSRKGFLTIILGTIILLHLMFPKKRTKNILFIIALIAILYILIMHVPVLYEIIGARTEALINYALGER
jgi:hypothetical protein